MTTKYTYVCTPYVPHNIVGIYSSRNQVLVLFAITSCVIVAIVVVFSFCRSSPDCHRSRRCDTVSALKAGSGGGLLIHVAIATKVRSHTCIMIEYHATPCALGSLDYVCVAWVNPRGEPCFKSAFAYYQRL